MRVSIWTFPHSSALVLLWFSLVMGLVVEFSKELPCKVLVHLHDPASIQGQVCNPYLLHLSRAEHLYAWFGRTCKTRWALVRVSTKGEPKVNPKLL